MKFENELDQILSSAQSSAELTAALKKIGEGSMQNGIKRIAKYVNPKVLENATNIGFKKGLLTGGVIGGLVTIVTVVILLYKKNHNSGNGNDAEGEAIIAGMQEGIEECRRNLSNGIENEKVVLSTTREELKEKIDEIKRKDANEEIDGTTYSQKMMELTTSNLNDDNNG